MPELVLIIHNVRSSYNVGSLLRTAEGLGVERIILSGFTPYPYRQPDNRLPHIAKKTHNQIHKTALGAEEFLNWRRTDTVFTEIKNLKKTGFVVIALEQTKYSISLSTYKPPRKIALIVGNEIEGLDHKLLKLAEVSLEIPMEGYKESFNVSIAAAIALFYLKTAPSWTS
jgi:23S rRNA (guanosine2251-2'-O)-methyltransferase